ncbi:MAG: aminotransferase class I/II-fold pyridoxal phosphate-dependent enzyme [Fusobacterium sp.]|nr:aminotransferase class I/II-fold pyridoxal phosphate-dependent enzyme [Fusobacterium sp.]
MSLIKLYKHKNRKVLFTTPSHSQSFFIVNKFLQFYKHDISETDAHDPVTALEQAESHAADIYGSKYTKFLTNGSTSGIIAAVLACVKAGDKVMVWEHAHPCHLNAIKLAGAEPVFYDLPFIKEWGVYGKFDISTLDSDNISAVIIASPSYEGIVSDVSLISDACRAKGIKLIVDEAHGALYPFSDRLPKTSIGIADFTVQSLHKTAGGLNPTALLHSREIDPSDALAMINTTSPSYPLLMTIEANINFLNSARGRKKLEALIDSITEMRESCKNVQFFGDDITKILIKKDGMTGVELSEYLFEECNIEDEKTNSISTMLLTGIGTTKKKIEKLRRALTNL